VVLTLVWWKFCRWPGGVGPLGEELARIGPDESPSGRGGGSGRPDVGYADFPHDRRDGRAEAVAGRRRRYFGEGGGGPDERQDGAAPSDGWLGAERERSLRDAYPRPPGLLALRCVLELRRAGWEEHDEVADDDAPPPVGGAADLAHHAGAEICNPVECPVVRKDDVVVGVQERVDYPG